MNISEILLKKYLGSEWTLTGNEYSSLEWLSDSPKPTEKQLEDLWPTVQAEIQAAAQAKIEAKASAISKLQALGLTVDEVEAAFGLSN
jgi:hypothetical protein